MVSKPICLLKLFFLGDFFFSPKRKSRKSSDYFRLDQVFCAYQNDRSHPL